MLGIKKPSTERHSRSIVKAISYRILSMTVDFIVAYVVTKDAAVSTGIVVVINGYSTVLYYLHERAWANIHWGHKFGVPFLDKKA